MSTQKIDPTLLSEIERLEQSDDATRYVSVIIELADAKTASQPLHRRLEALGAKNIEPLQLADAVVAELTPARVREIAGDATVKRVISNKPQKVEL